MRRTLFSALLLAAGTALAQDYPSKPIRIVVPLAPGGIADNVARLLGAKITETHRQTVLVENRPGANAVLGTEAVLKAPADGYTVLMAGSGTFAITPHLVSKLPYDAQRDFIPVAHVGTWANLLVVHPSVPAKTVKELIALAKSKPGALSYASQGLGSTGHITAEQFKQITGTEIVHIPYKGAAPAAQDLVGGQVAMMFDSVMVSMPQVRAGKLRALGITSPERSPGAPDVPTMAEAGLPGVEGGAAFGLFAPAGTPRAAIDWLNRETRRVLNEPEIRERMIAQGATVGTGSPESFAAFIAQEYERWGRVIRTAGIRIE